MKRWFSNTVKENVNTLKTIFALIGVIVTVVIFIYSKPSETKVKEIAQNEDSKLKNEILLIMLGRAGESDIPSPRLSKDTTELNNSSGD